MSVGNDPLIADTVDMVKIATDIFLLTLFNFSGKYINLARRMLNTVTCWGFVCSYIRVRVIIIDTTVF
jgi:hypothetical protein